MCGGRVMNAHLGIAKGYQRTLLTVNSAAQNSRYFPFREEGMAQTVMAPSGQNRSGSSWEQVFGLMTADEIARQENYKF